MLNNGAIGQKRHHHRLCTLHVTPCNISHFITFDLNKVNKTPDKTQQISLNFVFFLGLNNKKKLIPIRKVLLEALLEAL